MSGLKNVAILGATGAVGSQMLTCLEERDFPVGRLVPLASKRSAGSTVDFRGKPVEVREACPEAFEGMDLVLGAASDAVAKELLPKAVAAGAVVVDNSHAFRLDADVPLVIPEINGADALENHGIVANPNCATIIGLMCAWPLHVKAGLRRMIVSTYQAASGAGAPGIDELASQTRSIAAGEQIEEPRAFSHQLAMNLIPQIGGFGENGYTSEEMKMGNEGRKIMHLPDLAVNCTCVRVPVMRSHSESITCEFDRPITPDEAREVLAAAPGVRVVDDPEAGLYPMPLDTSDQDLVYVGRIREDISAPSGTNALTFWCCGDQIRKGAATNAVQIAELLIR
ncbi:MAG: aspartate-semialdehyde dehydrogenase [Atopobiaceae bacterium]|jgi:aspartate-semialdehyde dehydrogenase|nr:aspartate-semialdehyde dehydrogenase [Atopobiaceae bacterium]MCI2172866.1 aspartate-semialdehyde dehydrogenase [Atopobiaceae bacterium]MCI2207173.1 aspartate-semialdehyde dehydrogenase [Atopobiaceae bacterium]